MNMYIGSTVDMIRELVVETDGVLGLSDEVLSVADVCVLN